MLVCEMGLGHGTEISVVFFRVFVCVCGCVFIFSLYCFVFLLRFGFCVFCLSTEKCTAIVFAVFSRVDDVETTRCDVLSLFSFSFSFFSCKISSGAKLAFLRIHLFDDKVCRFYLFAVVITMMLVLSYHSVPLLIGCVFNIKYVFFVS